MEDKLNYSVFAYTQYQKVQITHEGWQYTRTRADQLLADARNDRDYLRGELYLDGTLLRWWEKGYDENGLFIWPVKIQGENLPRRKNNSDRRSACT